MTAGMPAASDAHGHSQARGTRPTATLLPRHSSERPCKPRKPYPKARLASRWERPRRSPAATSSAALGRSSASSAQAGMGSSGSRGPRT
jgi:hypothetical protein